jgi:hypothetical protein
MSTNHAITFLRAHDPARALTPATVEQRETLRHKILNTPLDSNVDASRSTHPAGRRRILVLAIAAAVMLGGVGGGLAASGFFTTTPAQEEQGLPGGSATFIGTHPTCTQTNDQRFQCLLKSAPSVEYIDGSYLGAKMPSVDASKHIDGGCIATSADGLAWDCYLGQTAVDHGILDASLLGRYEPTPSHG